MVRRLTVGRHATKGFTLIELTLVVGILGVASGILMIGVTRSKERQEIGREVRELRAAVERTRSLAMLAGSRLGDPERLIFVNCAVTSVGGLDAQLGFQVTTTGDYNYPESLTDNGDDTLTVNCRTVTLGRRPGSSIEYRGRIDLNQDVAFAFTAAGRLVSSPDVFGGDVFLRVLHTEPNVPPPAGIRILSSGLLCPSSNPNPALGTGQLCDED